VEPPAFTAQSALFELTRSLVLGGEFLALTVRGDFGTDYEHQGGVGRPTSISCRSPLPAASSKPSHDKHVASLSGESHYQTHPFCWHTNCMIN
jgi:hypothetical protein